MFIFHQGYSCVKISQPPALFDFYGYFVPPEQRGNPITLFRGCFVLDLMQVKLIKKTWKYSLGTSSDFNINFFLRTFATHLTLVWNTVGAHLEICAINRQKNSSLMVNIHIWYFTIFFWIKWVEFHHIQAAHS